MASALPLIVLLCLTVGLLNVSTAKACPPGWSLCGSRCFIVQARRLTMADAERNCIRLGGNLASIHSFSDDSFIRGLIRRACGSDVRTWIGLFDAIQEGMWLWTDGSRVVFTRWHSKEPNNSGGKEHCVEINFRGDYWNDVPCSQRWPSVCVRRR
ncbi:galactose-specific lectin nattectin-like [Pagrus major]|uniref:galactose-specific lectin nattectin-like n=1 Tax=Pagrus major TaxID=143350 RepID=UPI003CC8A036